MASCQLPSRTINVVPSPSHRIIWFWLFPLFAVCGFATKENISEAHLQSRRSGNPFAQCRVHRYPLGAPRVDVSMCLSSSIRLVEVLAQRSTLCTTFYPFCAWNKGNLLSFKWLAFTLCSKVSLYVLQFLFGLSFLFCSVFFACTA